MDELKKLEKTSFSGIAFDNIVEDLVGLIKNNPKYNIYWEDYTSNDYTKLLIELFAWVADNLATRIDFAINENFLTTAQQKQSIINLLKLIGYDLQKPYAALVSVSVLAKSSFVSNIALTKSFNAIDYISSEEIYTPPFLITTTGNNGVSKNFELIPYSYDNYASRYRYRYGTAVEITPASFTTAENLYFYEGTTIKETQTVTGNSGARVVINSTAIIENSVEVYLLNRTTNQDPYQYKEIPLYQVKSFTQPEAQSSDYGIPYSLNTLSNNGVEIEFGTDFVLSSSSKRPPSGSTIVIYYRIGGGTGGNIVKGAINLQKESDDVIFQFINNEAGYGGINEEQTLDAIKFAPKTIKTADRTVTTEDYDIVLSKNNTTLISKSYGADSGLDSDLLLTKYKTLIKPFEVWHYIIANRDTIINQKTYDYQGFEFFVKDKEEYINYPAVYRNGKLNDLRYIGEPLENPLIDVEFFPQVDLDPLPQTNIATFTNYSIINIGSSFVNKVLDTSGTDIVVNGSFKLKIREADVAETRVSLITEYTDTGVTDYALNFDFNFDFLNNNTSLEDFADGTEFRKTRDVKAEFKSRYNSASFDLSTKYNIKLSIDGRGYKEIDLVLNPAKTPAAIVTAIKASINEPMLPSLYIEELSQASYRTGYTYYNYPSVGYTGLDDVPISYCDLIFENPIDADTETLWTGSNNGNVIDSTEDHFFTYKKGGVDATISFKFANDDENDDGKVTIGNFLRLINNEDRYVNDIVSSGYDSPFKNAGLRAFIVDGNRLRFMTIDGDLLEITEEYLTATNSLFTMFTQNAPDVISSDDSTISYKWDGNLANKLSIELVNNFLTITSPKSGIDSSISFKESSANDCFANIFGYTFGEKSEWTSVGLISATIIMNQALSNFGNIIIENGTPYARKKQLRFNYVLDDSWEVEIPDLYKMEGSYFIGDIVNDEKKYSHELSSLNIKITDSLVDDELFENIVSLPFDYTQKGSVLGIEFANDDTVSVTSKYIQMTISILGTAFIDITINSTSNAEFIDSLLISELVEILNDTVATEIATYSNDENYILFQDYLPFYLYVNGSNAKLGVRNFDCSSGSFINFFGFDEFGVPKQNNLSENNLLLELIDAGQFTSTIVEEEHCLSLYNTGDYYIENGIMDGNENRTIKVIKNHSGATDISRAPDGNIYLHFVNDKTGAEEYTDEEYFRDYLNKYKIVGMQNIFMKPKVIPIDIVGEVTLKKSITKNVATSLIENKLREELKLGKLNFGEPMLRSYVESIIYSIEGVKYVNLTYIGENATISGTNQITSSIGGVSADFNEALVLGDDISVNSIRTRGIMLGYTNV